MDIIAPLVFAAFAYYAPNYLDNDGPYKVPISYSLAIYREAELYSNVEPEDVLATLVAEHGASGNYSADSIGKAGERGLLQISSSWRRRYNKSNGTKITKEEMLDPMTNIMVGVWVIAQMKTKHETKCSKIRVKEQYVHKGKLRTVYKKLPHNWHAHFRCAPKIRDTQYCETVYRVKLVKKFSHWRDWLPSQSGNAVALLGL